MKRLYPININIILRCTTKKQGFNLSQLTALVGVRSIDLFLTVPSLGGAQLPHLVTLNREGAICSLYNREFVKDKSLRSLTQAEVYHLINSYHSYISFTIT